MLKYLIFILSLLFMLPFNCLAVSSGTYTVIEAGGGNYTSVVSAEAGLQGVLTSTVNIVIQSTWTNAEGICVFSGWTTFSTAPVIVQATNNARHTGVWTATAHRFQANTSGGSLINIGTCDHIYLDGLQVYNQNVAGAGTSQAVKNSSTVVGRYRIISNCIIRSNMTGDGVIGIYYGDDTGRNIWGIYNNIVYQCDIGIYLYSLTNNDTYYLYNNTVSSCGTGISLSSGWLQAGAALYMKNNLMQFCATNFNTDWSGTGMFSTATNITSDNTSFNTEYRNQISSFTDRNGFNFHLLATDTTAYAKGSNLSSDAIQPFTTDIDGQIRPTNWSIGADDIPAVSARKKRCIAIIQ